MMDKSLSKLVLDDLKRSGLTARDAEKLGIEFLSPEEIKQLTGKKIPPYRIPYFDLRGKQTQFFRIRFLGDPPIVQGKAQRYSQPKGSGNHFYLPPLLKKGWDKVATSPATKIYITEGEKKAARACKDGLPTIGLGGVWNWKSKTTSIIKDFDLFEWQGRSVVIVFDSDAAQNEQIQKAERDLATQLRKRGAIVTRVTLPDNGNKKVGLDDYLEHQGLKAFQALPEEEVPIDPVVEEMNSYHAVITLEGQVRILAEKVDPVTGRISIKFFASRDMDLLHANKQVTVGHTAAGTPKTINQFRYWIKHEDRREYIGLVFAPNGAPPGHYNLWRGFAVEPKRGKWGLFRRHIKDNIAGGNKAVYDYILAWMADAIQNPDKRPGTSIALRGKQGTGKGVFVKHFGQLFGPHFVPVNSPSHITGNFNAHLMHTLILFADEAFWAGDKKAEGVLKGMVTEDTIAIEPKGKDVFHIKNHIRLLIASNNSWVVPAGFEERRFLVVEVGDRHIQDSEYFGAIADQMNSGGYEAMLYDLMGYDLKGVDLRSFPQTPVLLEQKIRSMSPEQAFWYERLRAGELRQNSGTWGDDGTGDVKVDLLYNQFIEAAKSEGHAHRPSKVEFGITIKQLCPGVRKTRQMKEAKRRSVYRFPALDKCRTHFEKLMKTPIEWDE
jgi:hypothetical protein